MDSTTLVDISPSRFLITLIDNIYQITDKDGTALADIVSIKFSHHHSLNECFPNPLCHHRHHCNQNCTSIRKADEEVDSDLVDSAEDTHRDKRYLTDCYNFE